MPPWTFTPVLALVPLTLLWRRVSPIGALCGFIAAIGLSIALFGTYTRCGLVFPVEFFLVFAAGARLGWRGAIAGWLLGIAAACLTLGWDASAPLDEAGVYICVLLTGVWGIGRIVHSRGRNVELQARTVELREARDERARLEVADDARACRPSSTSCCSADSASSAGSPSAARAATGAEATATLRRRSSTGAGATLEEMRAVVGVLRAPTRPTPDGAAADAHAPRGAARCARRAPTRG